jgi:transposase-like protein
MNLIEINRKFPNELSCIEYAERIRFGKKPKCAYCGSLLLSKRRADFRHKCLTCDKSTAVTVGTNLHNTRISLLTWVYAVSVITDAKKGMSALQLQRNINVSYPTAFSMYHKIRELMMDENANLEELSGIVEMDETYIGAKRPRLPNTGIRNDNQKHIPIPHLDKRITELKKQGFNFNAGKGNPAYIQQDVKRGRGTKKIPVVGIVERDGNVVAQVMRTLTYDKLKAMVKKYVDENDSLLITDEYRGYNKIERIIEHIKVDHQKLYSYKGVNTNTIESFWAIIKRGIMGQYHSVSPKMLPNYVAEFVYKYNNRKDTDGMFDEIMMKLLQST